MEIWLLEIVLAIIDFLESKESQSITQLVVYDLQRIRSMAEFLSYLAKLYRTHAPPFFFVVNA